MKNVINLKGYLKSDLKTLCDYVCMNDRGDWALWSLNKPVRARRRGVSVVGNPAAVFVRTPTEEPGIGVCDLREHDVVIRVIHLSNDLAGGLPTEEDRKLAQFNAVVSAAGYFEETGRRGPIDIWVNYICGYTHKHMLFMELSESDETLSQLFDIAGGMPGGELDTGSYAERAALKGRKEPIPLFSESR